MFSGQVVTLHCPLCGCETPTTKDDLREIYRQEGREEATDGAWEHALSMASPEGIAEFPCCQEGQEVLSKVKENRALPTPIPMRKGAQWN